jgi:hypothetical protein
MNDTSGPLSGLLGPDKAADMRGKSSPWLRFIVRPPSVGAADKLGRQESKYSTTVISLWEGSHASTGVAGFHGGSEP